MIKEVEDAFKSLTRVLLGKQLSGLDQYGEWLNRNHRPLFDSKSAVSGKVIHNPPLRFYPYAAKRAVKLEEYPALGKIHISEEDAMGISLANCKKSLDKVSYYAPEAIEGENVAVEECTLYFSSQYCYKVHSMNRCKLCAYSFWPRESEGLFGVDTVFASKFCLKCYCSSNLTRCFEVANSASSSDCYFCNNIENCSDCMFCFNVKNKKYAIGNVEYPRDEYMKLKSKILSQIADELEKTHNLKYDIYNIGCKK